MSDWNEEGFITLNHPKGGKARVRLEAIDALQEKTLDDRTHSKANTKLWLRGNAEPIYVIETVAQIQEAIDNERAYHPL